MSTLVAFNTHLIKEVLNLNCDFGNYSLFFGQKISLQGSRQTKLTFS